MKKRIQNFIGASLLALALIGGILAVQSTDTTVDAPVATQTELNMDNTITALP
ncbi:MAG: hypothetical protein AAF206_29025 [Bacteroidota bacterium]